MNEKRLKNIWSCMRHRCKNQKIKAYRLYGERGIYVCEEWESFDAFRDWALKNGYRDNLTLERKDNHGPYSPENCKWATHKEQANNRRDNVRLTFRGATKTVTEFAEAYGIPRQTLYRRLHRGWDLERALTMPVRAYTMGGETIV